MLSVVLQKLGTEEVEAATYSMLRITGLMVLAPQINVI